MKRVKLHTGQTGSLVATNIPIQELDENKNYYTKFCHIVDLDDEYRGKLEGQRVFVRYLTVHRSNVKEITY